MIAIVAFAIHVSATTPTYTTTGNVGAYSSWASSLTTPFPEVAGVTVEVYDQDSVIIRNWCGVEGYDLCVTTDDEGAVASAYPIINGVATPYQDAYGYWFVDTGLSAPQATGMSVYVASGYDYFWSDTDTQSGGVILMGYIYNDDAFTNSEWNYYFVGWGSEAPASYTTVGSVGKHTGDDGWESDDFKTPFPNVANVPVEVYGTDSIVARNWCGVEGYDICVTRDEAGNATGAYRLIDNVASVNASGGYWNVETGLESPNPVLMQAYLGSEGYGYAWSDDETKSGYILLACYTYDNLTFSNGQWTYFFLGWGDYNPGKEDGITTPTSASASNPNAPIYNLMGKQVDKNYKGIVIQNGRKLIRK